MKKKKELSYREKNSKNRLSKRKQNKNLTNQKDVNVCYLPSPGHGRQTPLMPNLDQSKGDFLLFPDVYTCLSVKHAPSRSTRRPMIYKCVQYA